MSTNAERLHWLERVYREDTLLAVELLAAGNPDYPEIVELERVVQRLHMLLAVHRLRCLGVVIEQQGRMFLLTPPGGTE